MNKYVVVGITKAGKSTLLNKLIGTNVMICNEKRATATRWTVNFHEYNNFTLEISRKCDDINLIKQNILFKESKELKLACKELNDADDI